jgi:hypothetical protein
MNVKHRLRVSEKKALRKILDARKRNYRQDGVNYVRRSFVILIRTFQEIIFVGR